MVIDGRPAPAPPSCGSLPRASQGKSYSAQPAGTTFRSPAENALGFDSWLRKPKLFAEPGGTIIQRRRVEFVSGIIPADFLRISC